jgi:hypothetical protein
MAELRISAEVLAELNRIVKRLSEGDTKNIESDFELIRKKVEIPPEITTKGQECGGCVSCGACPIVHIKAGYLLTATFLG